LQPGNLSELNTNLIDKPKKRRNTIIYCSFLGHKGLLEFVWCSWIITGILWSLKPQSPYPSSPDGCLPFEWSMRRELLPKLVIFKSPFPMSSALETFAVQKRDIINLFNRGVFARIESENPDYLLYYIHPALRSRMFQPCNQIRPTKDH